MNAGMTCPLDIAEGTCPCGHAEGVHLSTRGSYKGKRCLGMGCDCDRSLESFGCTCPPIEQTCPKCSGGGEWRRGDMSQPCPECDGEGTV